MGKRKKQKEKKREQDKPSGQSKYGVKHLLFML
jgi:hypothetical protein